MAAKRKPKRKRDGSQSPRSSVAVGPPVRGAANGVQVEPLAVFEAVEVRPTTSALPGLNPFAESRSLRLLTYEACLRLCFAARTRAPDPAALATVVVCSQSPHPLR